MRKSFIAASLCVALAGCQVTTGGTSPGTSASDIANQVQQTAAQICGFVPTVATIASILGTFTSVGPAVDVGATIAKQICAAVTPLKAGRYSARKASAPPSVNGVVIEGYFIR